MWEINENAMHPAGLTDRRILRQRPMTAYTASSRSSNRRAQS